MSDDFPTSESLFPSENVGNSDKTIDTVVILSGGLMDNLWPLTRRDAPVFFQVETMGEKSPFENTLLQVAHALPAADIFCTCQNSAMSTALQSSIQHNLSICLIAEPLDTGPSVSIATAICQLRRLGKTGNCLFVLPKLNTNEIPKIAPFLNDFRLSNSWQFVSATVPANASGNTSVEAGLPIQASAQHPETLFEFVAADHSQTPLLACSGLIAVDIETFHLSLKGEFQLLSTGLDNALLRCEMTDTNIWPDANFYSLLPRPEIGTFLDQLLGPFSIHHHAGSAWSIAQHSDPVQNEPQGINTIFDCENVRLSSQDHVVAAVGCKDIRIISTRDATLVAHVEALDQVHEIMKALQEFDHPTAINAAQLNLKWGRSRCLVHEKHYQVHLLTLDVGGSSDATLHTGRTENWFVLAGEVIAKIDGYETQLLSGQAIKIPKHSIHMMRNISGNPAIILETRTGSIVSDHDEIRVPMSDSTRSKTGIGSIKFGKKTIFNQ